MALSEYKRGLCFAAGARNYFQPFVIENPTTLAGHAGRKIYDVSICGLYVLDRWHPVVRDAIRVTADRHTKLTANLPPACFT